MESVHTRAEAIGCGRGHVVEMLASRSDCCRPTRDTIMETIVTVLTSHLHVIAGTVVGGQMLLSCQSLDFLLRLPLGTSISLSHFSPFIISLHAFVAHSRSATLLIATHCHVYSVPLSYPPALFNFALSRLCYLLATSVILSAVAFS